nr:PREDICTED: protocadherin alpha-8-like isoform X1 [Lepisosteus oculatus]
MILGARQLRSRGMILHCALLFCFFKRVCSQLRYSIPEESEQGAVVGNIAKDLGLDVRKLTERRFRIVSGSKEQLLQVNENNGILFVDKNIDREELCGKSSPCSINLKTVIENPLEIHYVGIEIVDINDHSPEFPVKGKHLEIAESTLPGSRFPLEAARDPDVGINSLRFYKLSQNDYFELEVKDRGEEGKIPFLILKKQLDRELEPEINLLLTAYDGGKPERKGSVNITVTVIDINDNAPVFDQQVYSVELDENVPVGTFVIKVHATDLDDGANREVVYSFDSSLRNNAFDLFQLDANTGEITVKGLIDFEERRIYEIDVQATDKGQVSLTGHCSVVIKIKDVNDNAPEIEVTSLTSQISEDSGPGTAIALISVADIDSDNNGQIVCTLSDNVPFELKTSFQENMYSLVTKGRLDRESVSKYNITITAKDSGQPALSSFKTIMVEVCDINDNSPVFSSSPYTFYLAENNPPGSSVFTVSASDRDQNENAHVSYHIWKGDSAQNSVALYLNINSENGNIYSLKSFDFESLKSFNFQVIAKDSGVPSLSTNVTVNVFILDQNDNAPVILSPLSTNGSAEAAIEVPRSVNPGYLVAKVRAYDADIGYNAWLSFSLLHVSDHSLFSLERYTGEIRTLRPFTEADDTEFKLIIQVKDNGNVSLSTTATILITTVERVESFAVSDFKKAGEVQKENNLTFYLMVALGSVSALFVISIILLVVIQCSRGRDDSSRYSQDKTYADVSGNGTLCHSIQYRAGEKRYMLVGPRTSIGSTIGLGSHGNTLVIPDTRKKTSEEPCS